jgi:hypothetical protein
MRTKQLNLSVIAAVAVVALLCCWIGYQAETETHRLEVRVDAMADAQGPGLPGERIFDLPDDGGTWHLTFFVDSDWRSKPEQRRVVSWFYTEPALMALRTQTHKHFYHPNQAIYRERFQRVMNDAVPAILITNEQGSVVYRGAVRVPAAARPMTSGSEYERIPDRPEELAGRLRFLFKRFRDRNCPCPSPQPTPEPDPPIEPDESEFRNGTPDIGQGPPAEEGTPWALLAVAIVVAALLSVLVQWKKRTD